MAKRKCMNKRLSRYSKHSTCSDFLDPDTDIVGNEYTYWWKNLENNSTVKLSMGSDMLQQTSRHLDSNSQIEASKAVDGWWNALEHSDAPDPSKMYKTIVEKKVRAATSTSESEEEPRIVRKKFTLRAKAQKPKGNVFLDALNDSTLTAVSESVAKIKRKSTTNNSASSSKTIADVGRSNETQETSSSQSHSANEILKVKPNIYKKNTKRAGENLFDDALKKGDAKTPSNRESVIISSNRKSLIVSGQSEALRSSQSKTNRFAFSFEKAKHFSPLRVPNAHSTILEDSYSSTSDTNNNREHEVLKPKPKFFVRQNKIAEGNLFEKILESNDAGETSVAVNRSSEVVERSLKASEIGRTSKESTAEKDKAGRAKELEILNGRKGKRKVEKSGTKSAENVKEIGKSSVQAESCVPSSDDESRSYRVVQKLRPGFLTKSRRNGENNLFQDVLADDDLDLGSPVASKSRASLDRSKVQTSVIEDGTLTQEQSKSVADDRESSGDSTKLHLSGVSSDEDIIAPSQSSRVSRKVSQAPSAINKSKQSNKSEANDAQIVRKKRSEILSTSNREAPLDAAEKETQSDKEAIPIRRSSRLANSQKSSEDSSKRQSGKIRKTLKRSSKRTTGEFETEEVESTENRSTKRQKLSQKESALAGAGEPVEDGDSSRKQSDRSSTAQKRLSARPASKSEMAEIESVAKRSNKADKESGGAEVEAVKSENSSKRQDGRLSRSQILSIFQTTSESEAEERESSAKRGSKSETQLGKESASIVAEKTKSSENRSDSKRPRDRSNELPKHSLADSPSESEAEEPEVAPKQNRSQVSFVSEDAESTKNRDTLKRQSNGLSKSQERPIARSRSKSKSREDEGTVKRASESRKESASAAAENSESPEKRSDSKRHSERLSELPKLSLAESMFESEAEEPEVAPKQNTSQVSFVSEEAESTKNRDTLKKRSNGLSKSQERPIARSRSKSKSREDEGTVKRANESRKESASAGAENSESPEKRSDSKRHSERLSKLPKLSLAESMFEFEPDEAEITSKRNRKILQNKSVSIIVEKIESIKTLDDSKKPRDRPNKSQERSIRWDIGESDSKEIEVDPKRDKSENKVQGESVLPAAEGSETIRDLGTPKRQVDHPNKMQKRSLAQIISQSGVEDAGVTPEQRRSRSRTQKEEALSAAEKIDALKERDSSAEQSDTLGKSQEPITARTRSKSKSKEREVTSKRSRSRSRTREEQVPPAPEESVKNRDPRKRQNNRLSKSQKPPTAQTRSKSKSKEREVTSKRNRSRSRTKEDQVSPTPEKSISPKTRDPAKSASESQESIVAQTESQSKSREDESATKRESRSENRSRNESASLPLEETESAKKQRDSRRQSERLSKLPRLSLAESMFEFEPESAPTSKRHSGNRVKTQKKSVSMEKRESIKDRGEGKMRNLAESQRYSLAWSRENSKSKETERPAKRGSENRRKAQKESISGAARNIESGEIQDRSKTRSDRPSKSQTRSVTWLTIDSDSEEAEVAPKRDSGSQSRLQKVSVERISSNRLNRSDNLASFARTLRIENGEAGAESVAGNQSSRLIKSQPPYEKSIRGSIAKKPSERFESSSTDESEQEEAESEKRTRRIGSIGSRMSSISTSVDEMDAIGIVGNDSMRNNCGTSENSESEEEESRSLIGLREDEAEDSTRKTGTGLTVSKRKSDAQNETGNRGKANNLTSPIIKTSVKSGSNILKGQKSITSFFKAVEMLPAARVLSDKQKADEIKRKVERVRELELARMKLIREKNEEMLHAREKRLNEIKRSIEKSKKRRPAKKVNEAYVMNGVVYNVARLSRPEKWITDRLYNYLWKRIEPKYKLDTKAVSEKFVVHMSNMTKLIMKRKSYLNYKNELHVLMREMARLGIIRTRYDFYQFAYDFFPYELRSKTVPMILPGNEKTIPYSPEELHEPILDS